jgi:hypothetical protein
LVEKESDNLGIRSAAADMSETPKEQVVSPGRVFFATRKFRRSAALTAMGLFMALAAGCARNSEKKKATAVKSPEKNAAASAQKNTSAETWQPRLGKILVVKDKLEFVLVDIGTAPAPAAGTILLAYTAADPSAELAVSSFQKRPYLIADIVSGVPKVGDAVAVKPQPPAVPAQKGKPAPAPALTGDSPPKISLPPWRPVPPPKDAGDGDALAPSGSRDPRGGADNPSGSEGIIPGLPLRTPR